MIIHYLKVALRNLWKYRTHSLISVLCLAVGITFYTVMSLFVDRITAHREIPNFERRALLVSNNRHWLSLENVNYLESLHIEEMDSLIVTSFSEMNEEVYCRDQHQREMPYKVKIRRANSRYFKENGIKVVAGDVRMLKDDEVVIHENFARRVFGDANPIGYSVFQPRRREGDVENFRIVGVVSGRMYDDEHITDLYYPLTFRSEEPYWVEALVKPGVDMKTFKERMRQVWLEPGNEDSYVSVRPSVERYQDIHWIEFGGLFIGSLILISGIVNFLKFIFQMFYNRQRELAIRKCVGARMMNLFGLLFAECFCMMSMALFVSMCISELCYAFAHTYMVEEITSWVQLADIYWIQFKVYLVVLALCMLICLYPVWRIRRTSVVRMVMIGTRRHVFRNAMIGLQMAISLLFVGGAYAISLIIDETIGSSISYLSEEEEEHTLIMHINSVRMSRNLEAILSDIKAMPEIESYTQTLFEPGYGSVQQYYNKDRSYHVRLQCGSPDYFRFFRIPMQGKEVEPFSSNWIYVSRTFHEQLQKDSTDGFVTLHDVKYQIAGVYENLHKERPGDINDYIGTVFTPDLIPMAGGYYYFRISPHADVRTVTDKVISTIRKYVPETLPLAIRKLTDTAKTYESTIMMLYYGIFIMAIISLVVVVLSIYSAISMDTIGRQKEVAIRKINGATPRVIAWLFGKTYVITYLIVSAIIFPLGRLIVITAFDEFNSIYKYHWLIVIFLGMALLIFLVTAFKIWQIMHVNPATIIKKE